LEENILQLDRYQREEVEFMEWTEIIFYKSLKKKKAKNKKGRYE
jgi:hypothetical protein